MNYTVAIFGDRISAEAGYLALETAGLLRERIALIGPGFQTLEQFGLTDSKAQAQARARQMALWLLPFGFIAGFAFNVQTGITIVQGVGSWGNHILGGLFGAIAGAMGSVFMGGGINLSVGNDSPAFGADLNGGKYLVAAKGSPSLVAQAEKILTDCQPQDLKSFSLTSL
ncbi:MAG: hypothetical protein HC890_08575 [Chloroflexaceae bacterium]|nr:hypothetical protein [Chloroflexaceae bacterium]